MECNGIKDCNEKLEIASKNNNGFNAIFYLSSKLLLINLVESLLIPIALASVLN